jgi:hypothetical protein
MSKITPVKTNSEPRRSLSIDFTDVLMERLDTEDTKHFTFLCTKKDFYKMNLRTKKMRSRAALELF